MNKPPRPPVPAGLARTTTGPRNRCRDSDRRHARSRLREQPERTPAVAHLGSTTTTNAARSQGVSPPATSNSSGPSAGATPGGPHSQSVFAIPGGNGADTLKFSECMRSHGVPNFPDPNGTGAIQASGLNVGSSSFRAAANACRHLLGGFKRSLQHDVQMDALRILSSRSAGVSHPRVFLGRELS